MTCLGRLIGAFDVLISNKDTYGIAGQADLELRCKDNYIAWLGRLIWAVVVLILIKETYGMTGQGDLCLRCPHIY